MPMIGADFGNEEILDTANQGGLLCLEIELSHLCNYRCAYCYLDDLTHLRTT